MWTKALVTERALVLAAFTACTGGSQPTYLAENLPSANGHDVKIFLAKTTEGQTIVDKMVIGECSPQSTTYHPNTNIPANCVYKNRSEHMLLEVGFKTDLEEDGTYKGGVESKTLLTHEDATDEWIQKVISEEDHNELFNPGQFDLIRFRALAKFLATSD